MQNGKKPGDLRKKASVRISFAHLNPALQEKIGRRGKVFSSHYKESIRESRALDPCIGLGVQQVVQQF